MGNLVSFMSANFVARQLGYRMTEGWSQGDEATSRHFRPPATFRERFEAVVRDVAALGFRAMDVWTAHLSPRWATPEHLVAARDVLDHHGLSVPSIAGSFGADRAEFDAACRVAEALGAPVLGGSTPLLSSDREHVLASLRAGGLRLGLENHPERTPDELRAKLGEPDDALGVTLDTGWFATHGYDDARAVRELADVLVHVHLKDVLAAGAHDTCRYGAGVVPLSGVLAALREVDYAGAISLEHEPETFDPTEDVAASKAWLEREMGVAA